MNNESPIETAFSLLKEIRDTTPIAMQRKRIDAFLAACPTPDLNTLTVIRTEPESTGEGHGRMAVGGNMRTSEIPVKSENTVSHHNAMVGTYGPALDREGRMFFPYHNKNADGSERLVAASNSEPVMIDLQDTPKPEDVARPLTMKAEGGVEGGAERPDVVCPAALTEQPDECRVLAEAIIRDLDRSARDYDGEEYGLAVMDSDEMKAMTELVQHHLGKLKRESRTPMITGTRIIELHNRWRAAGCPQSIALMEGDEQGRRG